MEKNSPAGSSLRKLPHTNTSYFKTITINLLGQCTSLNLSGSLSPSTQHFPNRRFHPSLKIRIEISLMSRLPLYNLKTYKPKTMMHRFALKASKMVMMIVLS